MKKIILITLSIVFVFLMFNSCGKRLGYTYEKTDGGIKITGYTGEETVLVIPEKIGKRKVVAIGKNAFDMQSVESVEIPDSVEVIERYAFRRCAKLTSVKLPNGLKEIADGTFSFCSNLDKIDIPKTVERIGNNAFGVTAIKEVVLPDSVKKVEEYAFYNCSQLESFTSGSGLTELGKYALASCKALKKIELNEGLKIVGESCFQGSSLADGIILPSSVEKLSMFVFAYTDIKSYTILPSIKVIEYCAFEGCESLKDIYIPDTVEEMQSDIFEKCKDFTIHGALNSKAQIYSDTYGYDFEEYKFD